MIYKLLNENGNYIDKITNERKNLLIAEKAIYSSDGINIDCVEFETDEQAIEYFGLIYDPINTQ